MYTGPLIVQSLMLNRRRLEPDTIRKTITHATPTCSTNGTNVNNQSPTADTTSEDPSTDQSRGPIPMIYLCATMWHENKQEMMQLMKSIFRYSMIRILFKVSKLVGELNRFQVTGSSADTTELELKLCMFQNGL